MPRWRLVEIWHIVAVVLLFPVVLLMGSQLQADWTIHKGSGLSGIAVVVEVESLPGGAQVLVDVTDGHGRTVARRQEVNGEAPQVPGARFPVTYLPSEGEGATQGYVAGHDPYATNLWVFLACVAVWFAGLLGVGARLWRRRSRPFRPNGPMGIGRQRAGGRYTGE